MSDSKQVLSAGYGTPLVWLFTPSGGILRDTDGIAITKYLEEFEYTYNEEEDDVCTLKFQLEKLDNLKLPYFKADAVIHLRWGYLIEDRKIVKSPLRKVAVRDIEREFKQDGIHLTLECTDLVSYLKMFKTQTIKHYAGGLTEADLALQAKMENHFLNWLKEVAKDNFNVTVTKNRNRIKLDKTGIARAFEYDEKKKTYTLARDNARVYKEMYGEFDVSKVIKGKSQSLTAAIQDKLKLLTDANKGGPLIMDGTDDTIHIKNRDFNQPIFKAFTYYGGTGELLEFKSNTNTRKIKEDKAVNSGINPYTKKVETTTVETADNSKVEHMDFNSMAFKSWLESTYANQVKTEEEDNSGAAPGSLPNIPMMTADDIALMGKHLNGTYTPKPNKQTVEAWLLEARKIFIHNLENPLNQKELGDLRYTVVRQTVKDPYMGDGKSKVMVTIPAKTILNTPEFMALNNEVVSNVRAQIHKENVLTGYTIESVQRKYEADAEIIGDPSMIKGKIIQINNVGPEDTGKWYITSASHKISMSKGYTCSLGLIRNPATITISAKTLAINPKYDRDSDELIFENEVEEKVINVYKDEVDNSNLSTQNLDNNLDDSKIKEDEIGEMENRLDEIDADEDYNLNQPIVSNPSDNAEVDKPIQNNTEL